MASAIPLPRPPGRSESVLTWARQMYEYLRSSALYSTDKVRVVSRPEGTTLDVSITAAGAAAAAQTYPWQPYAAPWTGSGDAPADWGLNIMIRPGDVQDGARIWLPATRNIVIPVPASCTDGYFVWLEATLNEDGVITALDYNHGATLPTGVTPATNTAGTPPPTAYDLLFYVTSTDTAVDLANVRQMRATTLTLLPVTTSVAAGGTERRMCFFPPNPTGAPF